jgi:predicted AlkP superfamily phosphohydrolase/phosphomutase
VAAETHCVGHQLWDEHLAAGDDAAADPLVAVYERLDAGLGRLAEHAGPDATIVVVFSHAMSAHSSKSATLDLVLDRIARAAAPRPGRSPVTILKAGWQHLPVRLRRRLHPAVARGARRAARRRTLDPDPPIADRAERPYAVAPGAESVSGVRLNQVGREARGVVRAEDRAATMRMITEQLLDLVDVECGVSAVRRVVNADEVVGDFPADGQADLLVEWNDSARGRLLYAPRLGIIPALATNARTGDHREGGGLVVVHGPGIPPTNARPHLAAEDVAPTIASLCGVSLRDVDGRPADELLSAAARTSSSALR